VPTPYVWRNNLKLLFKEELLGNTSHNLQHLFNDMLEALPRETRQQLKRDAMTKREMIDLMLKSSCLTLWCLKHGKACRVERADLHIAGSPCIGHSKIGRRCEFSDEGFEIFYAWCSQRLQVGEPFIIHESVQQFGTSDLAEALSRRYVLIGRFVLNPVDFGCPSHRKFALLM
jgi:site-specific DNA-cytosine methylase